MKLKKNPAKYQCFIRSLFISFILSFTTSCIEQSNNIGNMGEGENSADEKIESEIDLTNVKIGYCTPALNAPYYQALLYSIQKTCKVAGMTFVYADGQGDITKQIAAVEDIITKGVDALLLNPLDPNALVGVTKVATNAGIPVFIIDSSIDPTADYVTTIQSNNFKNGVLAGEWLVNKMGREEMNIALLSGNAGNPVGLTRKQGLLTGITEEQLRTQGYIDLNVKT
ncbi:MAG: substrate-binding domain-containing protein, partial [Bacteroidales bacterium]|nr:substrate-binding domain-containing protein [Bacteroidales bacterium]